MGPTTPGRRAAAGPRARGHPALAPRGAPGGPGRGRGGARGVQRPAQRRSLRQQPGQARRHRGRGHRRADGGLPAVAERRALPALRGQHPRGRAHAHPARPLLTPGRDRRRAHRLLALLHPAAGLRAQARAARPLRRRQGLGARGLPLRRALRAGRGGYRRLPPHRPPDRHRPHRHRAGPLHLHQLQGPRQERPLPRQPLHPRLPGAGGGQPAHAGAARGGLHHRVRPRGRRAVVPEPALPHRRAGPVPRLRRLRRALHRRGGQRSAAPAAGADRGRRHPARLGARGHLPALRRAVPAVLSARAAGACRWWPPGWCWPCPSPCCAR